MQKNSAWTANYFRRLIYDCSHQHKIRVIMKMSLCWSVLFLLALQLFAAPDDIRAQLLSETSITVGFKNENLKSAILKIEKISGFNFVYPSEEVVKYNNLTLSLEKRPLEKTLELLLTPTSLNFKQVNNSIILFKKETILSKDNIVKETPALSVELQTAALKPISGRVVDVDGKPVIGASIAVKGAKGGSVTNAEGYFKINVEDKDRILVVSFVGYKRQEISINDRKVINVVLEEITAQINEVVITGIFTRKAATYTGAATTVSAKELQQFGNRNLITSLRNVDPSFNIIESNTFGSDPNRLPEIQIRGNSSLPNVTQLQDQTRVGLNTPLVILDGFESSLQKLLDINANEVESITILKDASATAIYGSRGANGVVIITTKPPKPGKLRISYRADMNLEVPDLTAYNLLDARQKLDLEQKVGLYTTARAENQVPLTRYYNFLLNDVNSGVNTYWLSQPLTSAFDQRHNLRLEGGDQAFRYSASAQINDVKGVMKGSYRKNFNGTINLSYLYKNVKFSNNLIVGINNSANSPYGTFSDYANMNPYWRLYDSTGKLNKLLGNPGNIDYANRWPSLPTNPMHNATLNTFDKTNATSLTNNTSIEWAVTKDLQFRSRLGLTKITDQSDRFRPADHTAFANYSAADVFRKGDYAYGIGNSFSYDGSISVNYTKLIAQKHSVFAGIDYNIRQNKNSTNSFLAEGFNNPNFDLISTALQYAQNGKPNGSESLSRAVGITANVNYSYKNRYFADASFREDGSSQFGSNKRFAPFWSTGLGWNLDKEDFLKNAKFINRLKIRGSMGITGSQNFSSYQALSTYQYYTADRYYNWMGAYLLGLGNPNLQWQQKMNYDLGIEAQLFKQRISITADYYIGKTNNLVSSVNLPASNGFTSYVENIGSMENRGFEFKATGFLIRNLKKNIAWSVTAAFFQNNNKIITISQALKDAQKAIENAGGANPNILYREGYSTNTIWTVPSLGIDPSTGKELYLSKAGMPTFTWSALDLAPAGITDPKIQGNFSTMFRYKTFTANIAFGYRFGGQLYNQTLINKVENANFNYNVDSRVYENRWQNIGDQAAFKALQVTSATQMTSRFVQNEKTLNCQNINLQYELVSPYLKKKLNFELMSFSLSMADAFYLSSVKRERGLSYPFSRQVSFSISATF